ncbi:Eco29kI family restriction endonuclease [Pyxidicoccus parkwayensis]|uniref:Eco29kI family restriction endonuclease n=1 Tax=Pyxidicoccus parkwayensis TaxID=2813578 RepID=A0ABX7NPW8_9BACT|nr:Eco29kI family restriction endonuclease [Pyxidicoccus parkwaysis]QSQ19567.1 Eco29kI family restriction endonuclease [Pyxidicoccus parkwaysis]
MRRTETAKFATEFKLSITRALADQLDEKLASLTPHPLTDEALSSLKPEPGVYLLYHKGVRVYVGKAQQSLSARLHNHWNKLRGRKNIDINKMSFVCLYVDEDLDAAAPERLLIKKYRNPQNPTDVSWNTNGFGNKDPGRQRDKSKIAKNHFDAIYPINLAFNELRLGGGRTTVGRLLSELKQQLPYNLRFEKDDKDAIRDYDIKLEVEQERLTTEDAIALVIHTLPERWQATALPGYLILYPERTEYKSALRRWRRTGGKVDVKDLDPALAPEAEIRESTERDSNVIDEDAE